MYDRILTPTDGSRRAERAAAHALALARRFDATLHLLYVIDTSLIDVRALEPAYREAMNEPGDRAMDSISSVSDRLGVRTRRTIMQSRPHRGILTYVEDHDIDLVTLGRRGLTGLETVLLGSVSNAVLGRVSCPVIVVTGEATLSVDVVDGCRYGRILIATDGSPRVAAAADSALRLADATEADLHVLYVIDERATLHHPRGEQIEASVRDQLRERGERATRDVAERARASDVAVTEAVETGVPSRTIVRYAEAHDMDLIALGTTGRGGRPRQVLGSVAGRVIRHASAPVLVARSERRQVGGRTGR